MNSGVREDELEAFLKEKGLMMKTVTAGGSFSLGGITAVDGNEEAYFVNNTLRLLMGEPLFYF